MNPSRTPASTLKREALGLRQRQTVKLKKAKRDRVRYADTQRYRKPKRKRRGAYPRAAWVFFGVNSRAPLGSALFDDTFLHRQVADFAKLTLRNWAAVDHRSILAVLVRKRRQVPENEGHHIDVDALWTGKQDVTDAKKRSYHPARCEIYKPINLFNTLLASCMLFCKDMRCTCLVSRFLFAWSLKMIPSGTPGPADKKEKMNRSHKKEPW